MEPKPEKDINLRVQFDQFKDNYRQEIQKSISFIGQDLDFFTEVKVLQLLDLTRRYVGGPEGLKILDVGCGVGVTDRFLTGHFKKLYGVDLSPGVVKKAARLNPKASYKHYNGKTLPYATGSMDVTFAVCVMHHVLPGHLNRFVQEMARVTRKGGLVAIFEHNPWNPLTLRAVSQCEMDHDALLLKMGKVERIFGQAPIELAEKKFILFTPFRAGFFRWLEKVLGWLPLGAQYYVAAKR